MGFLSYVLYFIYDFNSIKRNNKFIKSFFLIGSLLNVDSTITFCVISFRNNNIYSIIFSSICSLLFIVLEGYSLFFSIDFKETYIDDSRKRKTYTKGMYSLCRHPGVLWYIFLFLSLGILVNNLNAIPFFFMMVGLNVLYIVYQDCYIFPKTFVDYNKYKKNTPFLVPFTKRKRR